LNEEIAIAWSRRPSNAVTRLAGRELMTLSLRDLLQAAVREKVLLLALHAPCSAAMAGFARAARECRAPLIFVRASGSAEDKGPEEARDDAAFTDSAFRAAAEARFFGPLALLKEAPRAGCSVSEAERVQREIDAGFTGVSVAPGDTQAEARDAALAATAVVQRELGLEIAARGGAAAAAELARQLRSRGSSPSAVRITGMEDEAGKLAAELPGVALSTADESLAATLLVKGLRLLVASGPFLRALRRSAPAELLQKLDEWADERLATPEQSAAKHQRLLRDLAPEIQDKLEALCCFEARELYGRAGALHTGRQLIGAIAAAHERET
jgi:hypothetical protein